MKKRFILISLCVMLGISGCTRDKGVIKGQDASPDAVPTLSPSYSVNGFDPGGTEYSGNLQLRPGAPGTYGMQWIITGSLQEGFGEVVGNQLLVRWRTVDGIDLHITGVSTYTITTEGELYGTRAVDGLQQTGTEKAFPNSTD
ncbi:MAG: hypothetical protein WAZ19_14275 [Anaerolineae bacterium]